MEIFDAKHDFLDEIKAGDTLKWLADDCAMEWPFFSWKGKQPIEKALQQFIKHCVSHQCIFFGFNEDSSEGTFLYKLTQIKKPILWCGIWISLKQSKVQKIRFIFDTFECFQGNKEIEIFGFHKTLPHLKSESHFPENDHANGDKEISTIVDAIRLFFLNKYGFPIQNTDFARERLHQTAQNAKNYLKTHSEYAVILPFFSANEVGPIQFFATVTKDGSSYVCQ